jgi:large subunit ribosomal protein L25
MPERIILAAQRRTVLGKKVKNLRKEGRLPGNIFGKGIESLAIDLDAREFTRTIKAHGFRSLFDLSVAGEPRPRPVVLRGMTRAGGMGEPLHVDFFQVDPEQTISATVPVRLVGESPAVRDLAGTLTHIVETLAIRCKPLAIPEAIEFDLSKLVSFSAHIIAGDGVLPEGVELMVDPSIVVATVAPPRVKTER